MAGYNNVVGTATLLYPTSAEMMRGFCVLAFCSAKFMNSTNTFFICVHKLQQLN
jgi:hypothetical protein